MSGSDVSIVAFGRPERGDAQSHVLLAAATLGATTRLVTSSEGEDFSSMDHGSIDWRGALDGAHCFVTWFFYTSLSPRDYVCSRMPSSTGSKYNAHACL